MPDICGNAKVGVLEVSGKSVTNIHHSISANLLRRRETRFLLHDGPSGLLSWLIDRVCTASLIAICRFHAGAGLTEAAESWLSEGFEKGMTLIAMNATANPS